MQHHTKPATSIFLKRFPYRERFFVASLIINLLSSHVLYPCFYTERHFSYTVIPFRGWLNIFSDSNFCSNFRHLALGTLHQNRDKLPTGFASGCQTALMNDRGSERPDGSFTLAPHQRSDFSKAFKISPKYTSTEYTRAQNEDVKLCRILWPTWALMWTRWQIETIKMIYLSQKKEIHYITFCICHI